MNKNVFKLKKRDAIFLAAGAYISILLVVLNLPINGKTSGTIACFMIAVPVVVGLIGFLVWALKETCELFYLAGFKSGRLRTSIIFLIIGYFTGVFLLFGLAHLAGVGRKNQMSAATPESQPKHQ